jgi:ABC-type transport system involved in cytochrome c biogenesis permease subunit
MSLWEYANPVKFLRLSGALLPWLWGGALVCLMVGLTWGFFFTPDDFRQGSTVKIIYLHISQDQAILVSLAMSALIRLNRISVPVR